MNIFDQTGVNEQGLRPTLKKTGTDSKPGSNMNLKQFKNHKIMSFVEDKDEKKVDFVLDYEKLNEHTFLNKLQTTVKSIGDYQSFLGTDIDSGRKMKMQGVVSQNCPKDIHKHFTLPDYKAEKIA